MPMLNNPVTSMRREILNRNDLIGYVVNNDDSKHPDGQRLQRCQIRVPQLHRNVPDEHLPWTIQDTDGGTNNAGSGVSNVNVPPIGSKVFYRVEDNDPHNPRYSGSPATGDVTRENELLQEDYPNTRGFVDFAGNRLDINAEKQTVNFTHVSGTTLHIDANGTVSVSAAHDINLAGQGNFNAAFKGTVNIRGQNGVNIDGKEVHLNSGRAGSAGSSTNRTRPQIGSVAGKTSY